MILLLQGASDFGTAGSRCGIICSSASTAVPCKSSSAWLYLSSSYELRPHFYIQEFVRERKEGDVEPVRGEGQVLVLVPREGLAGRDLGPRGKHQGRRWDSLVSLLSNCLSRAGKGIAR